MIKLDNRTIVNMDLALEQACRIFPHGGDHERRRYVAQKLKLSARKGNITLEGLTIVANLAVEELKANSAAVDGKAVSVGGLFHY
jgi:hypothetical protein